MFTDGRIDHFRLLCRFRSTLHRACNRYRYVSTSDLWLFNDSYGSFAPRTYHRFSLIAFIGYLGRNVKLVLRITTEQKSSTAIRVRTSCYGDAFYFSIHFYHLISNFDLHLAYFVPRYKHTVFIFCFEQFKVVYRSVHEQRLGIRIGSYRCLHERYFIYTVRTKEVPVNDTSSFQRQRICADMIL